MIKFEVLSNDNIDEVWEIEKQCFSDPWTRKMFEAELDNRASVYIVAREEKTNKAAGFGGVWTVLDTADITDIAVADDFKRQGIGEKILSLLIDICKERGVKTVNLEVRTDNTPAINLYLKLGFAKCGLRKKYYHGKYDAALMALEIQ